MEAWLSWLRVCISETVSMRHPRPMEHIAHMLVDPSIQESFELPTAEYVQRHNLEERIRNALDVAGFTAGQPAPSDITKRLSEQLLADAKELHVTHGEVVLSTAPLAEATEVHIKARSQDNPKYPPRQLVPDEQIHWRSGFPDYAPPDWTHEDVFANSRELSSGHKWADPERPTRAELDQRTTFSGDGRARSLGALLFEDAVPLNLVGRTGMKGRGLLGKWGPNHAADPIVTRYGPKHGRLQVAVIQRKDTGQVPSTHLPVPIARGTRSRHCSLSLPTRTQTMAVGTAWRHG